MTNEATLRLYIGKQALWDNLHRRHIGYSQADLAT